MNYDPQTRHIELMRHAPRAMAYQPGQDFAEWQSAARARLTQLLGLPLEMPADDCFNIEWERDEADFHEIRFTYCSEPGVDVCCNMLCPHGASGKLPMIICLQGHSKGMHISLGRPKYPGDEQTIAGGDRDFGLQIVRQGRIALVMEQRAFGERGGSENGPECYQPAMAALLLGQTLVGERCWDVSRGIDCVLKHFDFVDPARIALMGQSGGGTVTCYEAALDERISAAIVASAFCGYLESIGAQRHCSCNYIPGIMKYFDMGDIAGMIAPRPLIIVNGALDTIFPLESARREFEVARRLYAQAGAPDKVRHVIGPEGHRFYAALTWPVFDELTNW
ncbi:MAG TPA: acetylxylan esterase [Candidatus Fimadaptatus faecigallinarum]|uniref:Acetylxylan esterase n=1 Tax=Candidatus Fimadaptatus faecigallinarum TaxID=2840814 RepID=A0A9D1LTH3_9FIRM|nr:acetylxylan esterase [Candidatus Fimadaptatus faecigallinarum]